MIQPLLYTLATSMPMFVCVFLSAGLGLDLCRNYDSPRIWLLLWSLTCSVLYACHFIFFHHITSILPVTNTIYLACNLTVYPLYLIYIAHMTCEHVEKWLYATLLFAPLLSAISAILYALMSHSEIQYFIYNVLYTKNYTTDNPLITAQIVLNFLSKLIFGAEIIMVFFVGRRYIKSYNQLVEKLYADTEEKQLHRMGVILWLFISISLFSFIFNIIGRQIFDETLWLALPSILFSILLFAIADAGYHQRFSVQDIKKAFAHAEEQQQAPDPQPESEPDDNSLAQRFVHIIDDERLFLQPNVQLQDICLRLGTNRTYLLEALSKDLQMTFSEYINRRRIAYAQELKATHPELSQAEIAIRSGYSATSSFYRNWKRYAGK